MDPKANMAIGVVPCEVPGSSDSVANSVFSQAYETGLSSPEVDSSDDHLIPKRKVVSWSSTVVVDDEDDDHFDCNSLSTDSTNITNSPNAITATSKATIQQQSSSVSNNSESSHTIDSGLSVVARTLHDNSVASANDSTSTTPLSPTADYFEDKTQFVEGLVDTAMAIIQSIWPSAMEGGSIEERRRMPLRRFVQETLKRSKTLYSTFQVALYYLIMIKPVVMERNCRFKPCVGLNCGRRTFLASLMLASKYLQDRNYSIAAWSKISGLSAKELKFNEIEFLKAMDWNLHVPIDAYNRWSSVLLSCSITNNGCLTSHVEDSVPPASCATVYSNKRKFINVDEDEETAVKVVVI